MSSNKGLEASLEGMKDESPPGIDAAAEAFAPANQGEARVAADVTADVSADEASAVVAGGGAVDAAAAAFAPANQGEAGVVADVAADVAADAVSAVVAGGGAAGIEMKAAVGTAGAEASSDKEERAAEPSTQKASVGHADSAALLMKTLAESAVRATAPLTAEGMNAMLQSFLAQQQVSEKDFRAEQEVKEQVKEERQVELSKVQVELSKGFEKRVESLFVKASEHTATLDTKVMKLTGRVDAVTKSAEKVHTENNQQRQENITVHTENKQQPQEEITKAEFSVHEAQPQVISNHEFRSEHEISCVGLEQQARQLQHEQEKI